MLTLAGGGLHAAVTRKRDALVALVTVALGLALFNSCSPYSTTSASQLSSATAPASNPSPPCL